MNNGHFEPYTKEQARHSQIIGSSEIWYGPMFSDKTGAMLRDLIDRQEHGKQRFQIFRPRRDVRGDPNICESRKVKPFPAKMFSTIEELLDLSDPTVNVIAIDEAQFVSKELVRAVLIFQERGQDALITALDRNFRAEVFTTTVAIANIPGIECHRKHAWCTVCGRKARWSQLLEAPPKDGSDIIVGDADKYAARCFDHFTPR